MVTPKSLARSLETISTATEAKHDEDATSMNVSSEMIRIVFIVCCGSSLTKKAEPPPTCDANRDSGTASANGGWLRRLVSRMSHQFFPVVWFGIGIPNGSLASDS